MQGAGSCSELRPSLSTPPLPPNLCTQNKKHPHLPSNNTLYKITPPRCLHRLKDKSFPAPLAGAISWFTGMLSRLQGTGSCSELRPSLSAPLPSFPPTQNGKQQALRTAQACCLQVNYVVCMCINNLPFGKLLPMQIYPFTITDTPSGITAIWASFPFS